jgi:hypothetical protein
MVIMWPLRDERGSYAPVALSQLKVPFESAKTRPEPSFYCYT